ncbi:unnamed protein product [Pneumocystis jirovecii]|uniref:Uncharacterized protein n=2 Tax=Pneumocystis jirovecii TaxID=42068 RepID=L0PBJ4_PNEJI|nr:uncharacterized protein T551_02131 [Pneumocystis jirovecii RU7]KTW29515.1 hypothetical protein T551_02131 [Pneumocystis jirovecii RU7]CCJ28990.1 unnamed protein product [Pneumocystis jirovecii]
MCLVSTATFLLTVSFSVFVLVFFSFVICLFRFFKRIRKKNNECDSSQQPLLPSYKRIPYYTQPHMNPFGPHGPAHRTLPFCRGPAYNAKQMSSGNTMPPADCKRKSNWGKQRSLLLAKPTDNC